ncbi:TPA: hypothetical protein UM343_000897 [Stenotrophomonas maltophilia]|nr:hypothetical protein [Stenotrophomonas maltophilia]
MSNDNKTLADVQPGGRVRLGDRVLRVFSAGRWTYDGTGQSFSHEEMDAAAFVVYRDAALSAQPSPGGQDALIDALADDVESCVSDACGYLASNSGWDDYGIYRDDAAERYRALPDRIRELAARQPVGEPVDATDAMVEAALQSTVANNASPWRQVVASEDHADFISDMRAAINAALAARPSPIKAEATTTSTQTVPDHCDRIFWQHNYYQLPVGPTDQKKPTRRRQAAVETLLNLGFLWRNGAWIAPTAQAVDLSAVRDAVQRITLGFDGDLPYVKGIAEALALIDSQAVGNG